jgi:hypothetical protein
MTMLFAALIVGVIIFLLVASMGGQAGTLFDEVCREHPDWPWCKGGQVTDIQLMTSLRSTTALTCAINSVSGGSRWAGSFTVDGVVLDCGDYYTGGVSLSDADDLSIYCNEAETTPINTKDEFISYIGNRLLECFTYLLDGVERECGVFNTESLPDGEQVTETEINDWLRENGGENLIGDGLPRDRLDWDAGTIRRLDPFAIRIYSDTTLIDEIHVVPITEQSVNDEFKCTVKNFNLPQEVSNADAWIKGMGDPDFLVYWETFPRGEEAAWSGMSLWTENAIDLVFAWLVVGKVLKIGGQTLYYFPKKAVTTVTGAVAGVGEKISQKIASRAAQSNIGFIHRAGQSALIDYYSSQTLAKTAAQTLGSQIWTTISTFNTNELSRLTKVGITAGGVSLFVAYIDSVLGKYMLDEDLNNSVVMKTPFSEPKPLKTQYSEIVLLENSETRMYFASPCNANLEITKTNLFCSTYEYNAELDIHDCREPEIEDLAPIPEEENCEADIANLINYYPGNERLQTLLNMDITQDMKLIEYVSDSPEPIWFPGVSNDAYFLFHDLFGGITYKLEKIPLADSVTYRLEEMSFQHEGQTITWDIEYDLNNNVQVVDNDDVHIEFGSFGCGTTNWQELWGACIDIKEFDLKNQSCEACSRIEEYLNDKLKVIRFGYDIRDYDFDDGTAEEKRTFYTMIMYKNGDWMLFVDSTLDGFPEVATFDQLTGFTDWVLGSILAYPTRESTLRKEPKIMLVDEDMDFSFDTHNVRDCRTNGIKVKLEENDIDGRNYCYAEDRGFLSGSIRTVSIWGGPIGGLIGTFFGGLGPGTAAGYKIGTYAGATALTLQVGYESWAGVGHIWPGN